MLGLNKRQWFVLVLISLFIYGLTWGALLPGPASQVKPFGSDYPHDIPFGDDESHSASLPLWQAYQAGIALAPGIVKTPSKSPLDAKIRATTHYCQSSTDCGRTNTLPFVVDSPNTVFRFISAEALHQLDIPPPRALAAL